MRNRGVYHYFQAKVVTNSKSANSVLAPHTCLLALRLQSRTRVKEASGFARHRAYRLNVAVALQLLLKLSEISANIAVIQRYYQRLCLMIAKLFMFNISHLSGYTDSAGDQENRYAELHHTNTCRKSDPPLPSRSLPFNVSMGENRER